GVGAAGRRIVDLDGDAAGAVHEAHVGGDGVGLRRAVLPGERGGEGRIGRAVGGALGFPLLDGPSTELGSGGSHADQQRHDDREDNGAYAGAIGDDFTTEGQNAPVIGLRFQYQRPHTLMRNNSSFLNLQLQTQKVALRAWRFSFQERNYNQLI